MKAKYCQNCGGKTFQCNCPPPLLKRIKRSIRKVLHYTDAIMVIICLLSIGCFFVLDCFIYPQVDPKYSKTLTVDNRGDVKFNGIINDNDLELDLICTPSLYQYSYMIQIYNNNIIQANKTLLCELEYTSYHISFIRCDYFNVSIIIENNTYLICEYDVYPFKYNDFWPMMACFTAVIMLFCFGSTVVRHA